MAPRATQLLPAVKVEYHGVSTLKHSLRWPQRAGVIAKADGAGKSCLQFASQQQHTHCNYLSARITSRPFVRGVGQATTETRLHSPPWHASSKLPLSRQIHTSSCTRHFRFLISHAFQGKPAEPEPPLASSAAKKSKSCKKQIGWPNDSPIGRWRDALLGGGAAGEDSLMVATSRGAPEGEAGDVAIGVADGVGSWSESGVDPALFSQSLMYHASQAFTSARGASDPAAHPLRLISEGYEKVLADPGVPAGSSTAVVVTLESTTGLLRSANLGDSGFIVLREGNLLSEVEVFSSSVQRDLGRGRGTPGKRPLPGTLYRSSPQQYYFNAPYQLSKIPARVMEQWKRENGGESPSLECSPELASRWECNLKHGDIVVVGSDGAWDNVWGKEWVALVKFLKEKHHEAFESNKATSSSVTESVNSESRWKEERTLVEVIAHNALQYTLMCQFSEKKRSPFEAEAEKSRLRYTGGKVDDVAIIVAMVVEEETSTPPVS